MATCSQKQTWLASAETALHALLTGSKVESLQHGEKRMQYTKADIAELRKYVRELSDQVAACTGDTTTLRRRAFGVIPLG